MLNKLIIINMKVNKEVLNWLRLIGNKCKQLEIFELNLWNKSDSDNKSDDANAIPLFAVIGAHFCRLSYFNLTTNFKISDRIAQLKCCKQLTTLKIDNHSHDLIDDTFNDMHIHLPQLLSLSIESYRTFNDVNANNKKLSELLLMKNLQKLSICGDCINHMLTYTDSDICGLIDKCDSLLVLRLPKADITHTTIDAFIDKAKRNPKKRFTFEFNNYKRFDINDDLPHNLIVN